jgi:hypothetical protein
LRLRYVCEFTFCGTVRTSFWCLDKGLSFGSLQVKKWCYCKRAPDLKSTSVDRIRICITALVQQPSPSSAPPPAATTYNIIGFLFRIYLNYTHNLLPSWLVSVRRISPYSRLYLLSILAPLNSNTCVAPRVHSHSTSACEWLLGCRARFGSNLAAEPQKRKRGLAHWHAEIPK